MPTRRVTLALLAAPLLVLSAAQAWAQPGYEVWLDEREPDVARFGMVLAGADEVRLVTAPGTARFLVAPPACDAKPLMQSAPDAWLKPAGCLRVTWSARLVDHDAMGVDAIRPMGAWSRRNRLWILTGLLPWLRLAQQPTVPTRVTVTLAGGRALERDYRITPDRGPPLYLVVGAAPVRRYGGARFEVRLYGDAPRFPGVDALQRGVARAWLRWRRDILPRHAMAVTSLDVAWIQPVRGGEPGFMASTGSDAILMQYSPDPADPHPEIKLKAAVVLTGAHEGFHAFLGSIGGGRPAWVNESWATYFAYQVARELLSGESLAMAESLIQAPAAESILDAQRTWDGGNESPMTFYSKGARFWEAIDAVLTGPENHSGRLAALIQASDGMRGLDWRDADAVATWFDRHSNGRAGPIVHCYLAGRGCPAAWK